jgi:MerR family transcriptional regulator, copper efflux regulator
MRIGQLARMVGVTTSRIRFYEARGIIAPAARTANGYRDYDAKTAASLRFIVQSQDPGFSLDEIRNAVRLKRSHRLRHADVLSALRRKLAGVEQQIAEARILRTKIKKVIAIVEAN